MFQMNESSSNPKTLREKWKGIKHKELYFLLTVLLVIAFVWFFTIRSPSDTAVDTSSMTEREKLTYDLRDAVVALSGDTQSKIVIAWAMEENSQESASIFGGNKTNESTMIDGIAVICRNGGDARIKVNVTMMLSTLLGISPQRIAVYEKI